jgi:hypothetical protein
MGGRDDPFAGRMAPRLARIERELTAAVTDAQVRDWSADRPDRTGFARLGQTRDEVARAGRRYRRRLPTTVPLALLGAPVLLLTALLPPDGVPAGPRGPLVLAVAAATAVLLGFALRAAVRRLRRLPRATAAPPIDDPLMYASVRRRIEAGAVAARADRSYRRRAAATDLEYALDWLAAAQSHPGGPSRPAE